MHALPVCRRSPPIGTPPGTPPWTPTRSAKSAPGLGLHALLLVLLLWAASWLPVPAAAQGVELATLKSQRTDAALQLDFAVDDAGALELGQDLQHLPPHRHRDRGGVGEVVVGDGIGVDLDDAAAGAAGPGDGVLLEGRVDGEGVEVAEA